MAEDHPTEAACLLEQGASYRRRIGLEPVAAPGDPIFAGFKQGAFSLYFGDAPIYHFDLEGRWQRAFVDGTHYLKGLDATVHAIDRVREGANLVLKRRTLANAEASDLDERVRSMALELIVGLDGGALGRRRTCVAEGTAASSRRAAARSWNGSARWDAAAWFAHRERYRATYGPLPFLPPECQNAVVLQATLGSCRGSRASAGASASEAFMRSIGRVRAARRRSGRALGPAALAEPDIFLAGSDVLHQPVETSRLTSTRSARRFRSSPEHAEAQTDRADERRRTRVRRRPRVPRQLRPARPDRAAGASSLQRGWCGSASASSRATRRFGRSITRAGPTRSCARQSSDVKAAGLGVSVLTLVGAGGVERAEPHVERTAQLDRVARARCGRFCVPARRERDSATRNRGRWV